ncbi:MAG: aminotransferase class IV [Spirochaetaceae bacterium]|nr:aminotransferase class IV [Spirochaetaceae bacterium]
MKNLAYYNGKISSIEEMTVPINDRSVFLGDGVYDATMAANHKIFEPEYHLERFYNSMKKVRITPPLSSDELLTELQKCVNQVDSEKPLFLYWQVTRGTSVRSFTFPEVKPNLIIYIYEASLTDLRHPWKVITKEDTRFFHCDIKTVDLLPAVLASQEAKEKGCDEVIFHRGERVTECAHNNVNILKNGKFITPPLDNLILPGTARRHFIEICGRLGVPVEERPFTIDELLSADEVMITCSATYGVPVCQIDGKPVGGKDRELLYKLQKAAVDDFIAETGFVPDIL